MRGERPGAYAPAMGMVVGWLLIGVAMLGIGYTLAAVVLVERWARRGDPPPAPPEPVSVLKPLYGAEPRLLANLQTALDQHWAAPIELVAGVADPADRATAAVAALRRGEGREVVPVVDPARHGANAKVGNLLNMLPAASHDLLVVSDCDIAAPPDWLAEVAAALAQPGVGAVTCLYRGRADGGVWSALGAAMLSWQFLPAVIVGLALGDERACMGSTIALRRGTLAAIGGFGAFADTLADDHAIGAAVRARGLRVAVPRLVLAHGCTDASLAALIRHELRWATTVRTLVPAASYAASVVTLPLAPALLALAWLPRAAAPVVAAVLGARWLLAWRCDRLAGARTAPLWCLPLRDLLSFAVFVASFAVRSVDWRGARLTLAPGGRIAKGSTDHR